MVHPQTTPPGRSKTACCLPPRCARREWHARYTYCIAHAINRGWIDPLACGPVALLGWHAVSTKVNAQGQVEGTCVGTGIAFDPVFYYCRPTNVFAAQGYGPVLLAGAEMIKLLRNCRVEINDSSVQFYRITGAKQPSP